MCQLRLIAAHEECKVVLILELAVMKGALFMSGAVAMACLDMSNGSDSDVTASLQRTLCEC